MRYKNIYFWCIVFILLGSACEKSDPIEPENHATILFYMAADNNIDSYVKGNISDILKGMVGVQGRVVIYVDALNDVPVLMTVRQKRNHCVLDTIETYEEENSASPEVLRRVTNRVRELYPASYTGLVIGTHGSGWIPQNVQFPQTMSRASNEDRAPITRYLGRDVNPGNSSDKDAMEIEDLVSVLPQGYEFILFDACLMANIEVMYALRHKAKYLIASAPEILLDGFPYDEIMPSLWEGEEGLKNACQKYRNYYENNLKSTNWQSGMISLVRTAYLDALAQQSQSILHGKLTEVSRMDISEVDRYPLIDYTWAAFFDFNKYIQNIATEIQYIQFKEILECTISYWTTTKFNGLPIEEGQYCGLSTYIPLEQWSSINQHYYALEWVRFVYGE